MLQKTFCLIKTCAPISNSLFNSDELVTFSPTVNAQCQSNMASMRQTLLSCPWKHLNEFQLKWVIYMPKKIFCLIKTCALISNSLFNSDELVTFSQTVNVQCSSNIVSIKQILRSRLWKINDILTQMGRLHVQKYGLLD